MTESIRFKALNTFIPPQPSPEREREKKTIFPSEKEEEEERQVLPSVTRII